MILIADSGSTKTTWSLCRSKDEIRRCTTSGINPFYLEKEEIFRILDKEYQLPKVGFDSLFFYGA